MSKHSPIRAARADPDASPTMPATTRRARHDGWTPERQAEFLTALAASACVTAAAAAVGMSSTAAYALRARPEAQAFRLAWDAAIDLGVRQLADAALSRALHGTVRPIFFQGEQVGERRYFDERLTQFILRVRDPVRFGKWRENCTWAEHFDGRALIHARMQMLAEDAAFAGEDCGSPALPDADMLAKALAATGQIRKDDPNADKIGKNSDYRDYRDGYVDGFEKAKLVTQIAGADPAIQDYVDWYDDYLNTLLTGKRYPDTGT
jgi:hypothetical protein